MATGLSGCTASGSDNTTARPGPNTTEATTARPTESDDSIPEAQYERTETTEGPPKANDEYNRYHYEQTQGDCDPENYQYVAYYGDGFFEVGGEIRGETGYEVLEVNREEFDADTNTLKMFLHFTRANGPCEAECPNSQRLKVTYGVPEDWRVAGYISIYGRKEELFEERPLE
jgi:hypothetical protein